MYTKFYDNTIVTKFVKELVARTNVPFISTWKPGDFAIRGMFYITSDSIWKCLHTGWPKSVNDFCDLTHETRVAIRDDDGNITGSSSGIDNSTAMSVRFFERVSPYVFGQEYFNITGNYKSDLLGYDAITHFYLGQYLRMMRDIYDLDLMPFYNCYGGENLVDIDFNAKGEVLLQAPSDAFKILSVPVKFGKTYMIAIDSELPVETCMVVYGDKGLIKDYTDNLNDLSIGGSYDEKHNTYKKYQRTQFKTPVFYTTPSWHQLYKNYVAKNVYKDQDGKFVLLADTDAEKSDQFWTINDKEYDQGLGQFEKYLRLLIKLPSKNTSSIVVIEGDYRLDENSRLDSEDFKLGNFDQHHGNVTWSNKPNVDFTVNSKMVTGDWIRPERIENSVIDKAAEIEYKEVASPIQVSAENTLLDLLNNSKIKDIEITSLDLSILLDSFDPTESFTEPRRLFVEDTNGGLFEFWWDYTYITETQKHILEYSINEYTTTLELTFDSETTKLTYENSSKVVLNFEGLDLIIKNTNLFNSPGLEEILEVKYKVETIIESQSSIPNPTYKKYEEPLLSPLGLLQMSDGNTYAFSDRLIEYLLQNAINHLDEFGGDISRIQKYAKSEINALKNNTLAYQGATVDGVWDEDLRRYLFNLTKKSKYLSRKIDLTGYVDRDTEMIITRGQRV